MENRGGLIPALTVSEKDRFTLDALGVGMSQVEAALKSKAKGNEKAYLELLVTASQVNKTTPEQIGKFFNEFISDELFELRN